MSKNILFITSQFPPYTISRGGVIRVFSFIQSLKKTNKVVFIDEDVSGGATAYMMQKVLEEEKGYFYLDSENNLTILMTRQAEHF